MLSQLQIFYNNKWTCYDDNSFLTNLEFFAYMEKRPLVKADRDIMKKVRDWLNPKRMWHHGHTYDPLPTFTLSDIYRRFEFAELRYNTWRQIIEHDGVNYNPASNTIDLSGEKMVEICEMHSLGEAYLHESEYRWRELQVIFGPHGSIQFGPSTSTQSRQFNRMMKELLADMARDEPDHMDEDVTTTDEEIELPKIPAPDLMSTTKGEGHILEDPVAKHISPQLRMAPVKMKGGKNKATCSAVVKKLLWF